MHLYEYICMYGSGIARGARGFCVRRDRGCVRIYLYIHIYSYIYVCIYIYIYIRIYTYIYIYIHIYICAFIQIYLYKWIRYYAWSSRLLCAS